jgi:serine/threonine-protein kinase
MPELSREQWRMLSPLLDHALELTDEERGRWLDELSEGSPEVAASVAALLSGEVDADRGGFLAEPPDMGLAGLQLGGYTIERALGHGGMGTVWLARRTDGRFEGVAAVKFLNLALLSDIGRQRFQREGSVLARLSHPGIARLLDAGVGNAGQPYLILEHVDGRRIDTFATERGLDLAGRIRLFLQVVAAVEHAHANLIVHRDLKPSNILVTRDGAVKLLDFGIAKLLDEDGAAGRSDLTSEGGRALTPEFAAPEQVQGETITTATDIYSLGVLLYLLVSGRHPTAEGRAPGEALRALMEEEPARLGLGDLDLILRKALRKRPAERYRTVTALGDDLGRYLRQEPVSARPDSLSYRLGKFLRRNRLAVAAAALALAGLIGLSGFALVQMREARRQRDAAVLQGRRADAQAEFQSLLMSQVGSQPLTLREILDRARVTMEHQYRGDPRFLSSMLLELSTRYGQLDDKKARGQLLAAAESLAVASGNGGALVAIQCERADHERTEGNYDRAWALHDSAAGVLRAHPDMTVEIGCLQARSRLAYETHRGPESIAAITRAIALQDSTGETGPLYADMLIELGGALTAEGRRREAVATYDRAIAQLDSSGRGGEMARSFAQHNKALTLLELGETRAAERELHEVLAREAGVAPDGRIHPQPLVHYAETALAMGLADTAVKYFRRLYDQAVVDTSRYWQGRGAFGLARAQVKAGLLDDARSTARTFARISEGFEERLRHTDDEIPDTRVLEGWIAMAAQDAATAHADLARALEVNRGLDDVRPDQLRPVLLLAAETALASGMADSALRLAREALAIATVDSLATTRSARVGEARLIEGEALAALGETTGARTALMAASRALAYGAGPDHPRTRRAGEALQAVSR